MNNMNNLNDMVMRSRARMEEVNARVAHLQHCMSELTEKMRVAEEQKRKLSLDLNDTMCKLAYSREELCRVECELKRLQEMQSHDQDQSHLS
ncbi:hypothetical protein SAMN05720468_12314 [Fibrobacter sp. UWEL]|nr:hypothetical protein SAMN05720468_12314 [Fibrobacter sp. UWEL]